MGNDQISEENALTSTRTVLRLGLIVVFLMLPCLRAVGQQSVNDRLRIEVDALSGGGSISLGMANESEAPLKIFKTTNGWGANRYRVLVLRKARVYGFFEESKDAYFYTHPGFSEIAPHSRLKRSLDLNDGNVAEEYHVWCGTAAGAAVVPDGIPITHPSED